ncbi:hypothetical protein MBLNU459_g0541t2 [Dothideomycetes sp. NU459]
MPPQRHGSHEFASPLRAIIKNRSYVVCQAFIEEAEFCIIAANAGTPIQATVDGAFICDPDAPRPPRGASFGEMFRWAWKQTEVPFIAFDHKTGGLTLARGKQLRYISGTANSFDSNGPDAQVYVVTFESARRLRAIVPKMAWERAIGTSHGLQSLVDGVPSWYHPFIVRDDHLEAAVQNMILAATTERPYRNPTTGVVLTGWKPRPTCRPPIKPLEPANAKAFESIMELWGMIEALPGGERLDFNPYAPLIADNVLVLPDHDGDRAPTRLIVEFKSWVAISRRSPIETEEGDRSVFAPTRQWDLLVGYDAALCEFVCIGRHEVEAGWADGRPLLPSAYRRFICQGVGQLIERARLVAKPARIAVEEIIRRNASEGAPGAATLVSTGRVDAFEEDVLTTEGEGADVAPELADGAAQHLTLGPASDQMQPHVRRGHTEHAKGLHWVAQRLNLQCAERGHLVVLTLDPGHPIADHMVVDWEWTQEEREAFLRDRKTLPVRAYSEELADRICGPLRFQDMSGGTENWTEGAWPIVMRQVYWTRPACDQQFLIVGSTLEEALIARYESPSMYVVLPSGFTSQFRDGVRHPDGQTEAEPGNTGEHYFRKLYSGKDCGNHSFQHDAISKPKFSNHHTSRMRVMQGGPHEFIADPEVDPLRSIVNLNDGSIYELLFALVRGEEPLMCVKNTQSTMSNKPFEKKAYLTTVRAMHQAQWDYGVTRYCTVKDPAKEDVHDPEPAHGAAEG